MKDPELPQTLEELNVIEEEYIRINKFGDDVYSIQIEFKPTVPHCSLATLIGELATLEFCPVILCSHINSLPLVGWVIKEVCSRNVTI